MKQSMFSAGSTSRFRAPALALFVLIPALVASGCGHREVKSSEEATGPSEVEVVYPKVMDLTRQIEQPGQFISYEHTPIYTKIAGFAEEPYVDIGDTVKKDQLLVKLYVPEVVEELNVKKARVKKAEADKTQIEAVVRATKAAVEAAKALVRETEAIIVRCEADVRRWEKEDIRAQSMLQRQIYDKQTRDETLKQLEVSRASLEEAKAKHDTALHTLREREARYEKALADVEVAEAEILLTRAERNQWAAWLSYADLKAPFDGVITHRNVHTGHFLQPSNSGSTSKTAEPLFMVMRTDIMRITVQVPEIDTVYVKVGDRAVVRPQALPGREVLGTVTRFSWSLDEHARTLRVEVHVPNPKGILRPGMYANVTLFAKQPNALTLPAEAILSDILAHNDRSYCVVVENGKCRKMFLQLGLRGEEGVQVLAKQTQDGKLEDLTGTEAVVVSHPASLLDGQVVQLKKPQGQADGAPQTALLKDQKSPTQTPNKE
jgi:HlyD family secretion protein